MNYFDRKEYIKRLEDSQNIEIIAAKIFYKA